MADSTEPPKEAIAELLPGAREGNTEVNSMTESGAKKKVTALALAEVGYREGANNFTKYAADPRITRLYGWNVQNQPWCGTFVNWLFMETFGEKIGSKMTFGGSAACVTQAGYYKAAGRWYTSPQVGDQIFFYSGGGINHTGIVAEVNSGSIRTVEGNYSDKVSLCTYVIGNSVIAGYGRPDWSLASDDDAEEAETKLRKGSRGEDVVALQKALIAAGFSVGDDGADGKFGDNTEKALLKWQADNGIDATGEILPSTIGQIKKPSSTSANAAETAVQSTANQVDHSWKLPHLSRSITKSKWNALLQQVLICRNFDCGSYGADGYFGKDTQEAVKEARDYFGLTEGAACDDELWAKLMQP